MINNDLLADRLNAYLEGVTLPPGKPSNPSSKSPIENRAELVRESMIIVLDFIYFLIKISAYGFAIQTIFATDWKWYAAVAVGFTLETLLGTITNIFKK